MHTKQKNGKLPVKITMTQRELTMTKKQILLSTLILTVFNNIACSESENKITRYKGPISERTLVRISTQLTKEGVDIQNVTSLESNKKTDYKYPQLPSQLNDFHNFDKTQYIKEYQDAIDRELDDRQQDIKNQDAFLDLTSGLERNLMYNLIYIRLQQNSLSQQKI